MSGRRQAEPAERRASERDGSLVALIENGGIHAVFQPIVDIDGGAVLGYEALARGPEGHPLESPAQLFGAAAREGLTQRLDAACQRAAFTTAVSAGLRAPLCLFVNVEPTTIASPERVLTSEAFELALRTVNVIFEVTERALTDDPAELLEAVASVRRFGCGIALDDVGADQRSLALMPLLRPDVIKLDLRLVQQQPSTELAQIAGAVQAQAERTGAAVLAEGIEHDEHAFTARALGATLGQGYRYGRPGPLPARPEPPPRGESIRISAAPIVGRATPFEGASKRRTPRLGRHRLLVEMSKQLEEIGEALSGAGIVIGAFQKAERFTTATRSRYARLASKLAFVAALGEGLDEVPAEGVRGGALDADDPLLHEWSVAVLGPHASVALAAREVTPPGVIRDSERSFEFVVTYERIEVVEIVRRLFDRIAALR